MQLIPFIDSTDQLNWSRGNAGLRPEFTNSLEMSYSKTYKGNNNFLASVYYKQSTDLITTVFDRELLVVIKDHPEGCGVRLHLQCRPYFPRAPLGVRVFRIR